MVDAADGTLPGLLRKRMQAQADLFAAVTSHPTLIGSGREDALAEFLRQLLPRRLELLSGTIAIFNDQGVPEKSTNQIDLIVADTVDYPTLLRVGGTAVVLPPAVRALIEVKSGLTKGADFVNAVIQSCRTKQMLGVGEPVFTTLFSFTAPAKNATLRGWLEELTMLRRTLTGEAIPEVDPLRQEILGKHATQQAADELLAILSTDNLPDMVVADNGGVVRKTKELDPLEHFYSFLTDDDVSPAVAIFVDQLLQHLSATAEVSVVTQPVSAAGAIPAGPRRAMELMRAQFGVKLKASEGDRIPIPRLSPSVSS